MGRTKNGKVSKAVYHLIDDIDDNSARDLSKALLEMRVRPEYNIELLITSGGGDPACAFALYDLIRSIPNKVTTVAAGNADSAATIIFLAGDERVIMPNATILMHTPRHGFEANRMLPLQEVKRICKIHERMFLRLLHIFTVRTGQKTRVLKRLCYQTKILSAKEAVKYGFAHKMGYPPKDLPKEK